MKNKRSVPGHRGQWDRLVPPSSRSRFTLGLKVAGWALAAGAAIVTFATVFGWGPVLITAEVSLLVAMLILSAYLHRRAWVVIREEMQRADEAEQRAKDAQAHSEETAKKWETLAKQYQQNTEHAEAYAEEWTTKWRTLAERATDGMEEATAELLKRNQMIDEIGRRLDEIIDRHS